MPQPGFCIVVNEFTLEIHPNSLPMNRPLIVSNCALKNLVDRVGIVLSYRFKINAALAQSVERRSRKAKVAGSIPAGGSIN